MVFFYIQQAAGALAVTPNHVDSIPPFFEGSPTKTKISDLNAYEKTYSPPIENSA
jgi:hypothetical protein